MVESIVGTKLNKGEWAEFYVMLKLLGEGKLYTADKTLKKKFDSYLDILKIIRQEYDTQVLEYIVDENAECVTVKPQNADTVLAYIPMPEFVKQANDLFNGIRDMTGDEILNCYTPNVTQVLVGCAPCQPFSQMSIKRGEQTIREDEKYNLLLEFGRMIRRVHPTVISMENVPKIRNTDIFKEFLAILDEEGYYTDGGNVVYCPDYGIPQNRHRFVLLASNLGEIHLMPPTHNRQDVTVRSFIENLPPVEAGEICPTDPMHRTAHLSDKNLQRIRASVPGGTWKDWPEELRCECHKKDTGKTYTSVYGRMRWDAIGPTMTTQFHCYGTGRYGHPVQDRALTLREGALLQTFPNDYDFINPDTDFCMRDVARHIGNAVPVRLVSRIVSTKQIVNRQRKADADTAEAEEIKATFQSGHIKSKGIFDRMTEEDKTAIEEDHTQFSRAIALEYHDTKPNRLLISHRQDELRPYGDFIINVMLKINPALSSRIVFTSNPHFGLNKGRNIFDELKQCFRPNYYILFLFTKSFYDSNACLAEAGAAWATNRQYMNIVVDIGFSDIDKPLDNGINGAEFKLDTDDDIIQFAQVIQTVLEAIDKRYELSQIQTAILDELTSATYEFKLPEYIPHRSHQLYPVCSACGRLLTPELNEANNLIEYVCECGQKTNLTAKVK